MTIRDRTAEFQATVESFVSSRSGGSLHQPLLRDHLNSPHPHHVPKTKTEFSRAASSIAKEISTTVGKLQKLALLAKRKTLFDDKPLEINDLIYVIKQDIGNINRSITGLQAYVQNQRQSGVLNGKQLTDHTSGVITSLQSQLSNTTTEFKEILEIRTQNLTEAKNRKDQYSSSNVGANGNAAMTNAAYSDSPLFNPTRRQPLQSSASSTSANVQTGPTASLNPFASVSQQQPTIANQDQSLVIDMGSNSLGSSSQAQQSLSLLQRPTTITQEIIDSRSQAISSIESTILELGQIYQNFAQILSTQRETIQRIDDNVLDVEMNVEGAQNELLKYYEGLVGNRWLMIKVFAVIITFFVVFLAIM